MTRLVLSLGSNIEREKHIRYALDELEKLFGQLDVSPVYETRAVGFDGPDFYNLVATASTSLTLERIVEAIKSIEQAVGRIPGEKRFESRRLDIDILLWGELDLHQKGWDIPREEIARAAYVLKPLSDLLPDMRHPVSGKRFASMWEEFDDSKQALKNIGFQFSHSHVC